MVPAQKESYKYLEELNEAVLRQVPLNKTSSRITILDVGCGTAALSEAIEDKGYAVCGIELNQEAAEIAAGRITRVVNANLTDITFIKTKLKDELFDYVIFADVLEHLYEPARILKEYLTFLKPGGLVVVSVPNTVAWSQRIMFLLGRFEYSDTGIMDKDHIRFFTFKTAKDLVRSAGCSVVGVDYIPYFVRIAQPVIKKFLLKGKLVDNGKRRTLIDSPYYKWYMRYINPIEYFLGYFCKTLFAFKLIIVGRKLPQGEAAGRGNDG